ncbi:hypothetical protein BJY24_004768 [Nocardia transvalensis]|uniref:Uncharacterized protein n=1 Tax=Nocardia transvalensis TaxID=37333 RepID=A0A7W9UJX8_9NOCA|nr:hypothetical protein [Nocardia transvalensis]MBB5915856.1 hypothetical protein [Nocardia transvalensis]
MSRIDIEDLPADTAAVLRRRAAYADLPVEEYVHHELTALSSRRVPIDSVVEFLEAERPDHPAPAVDEGAMSLIETYRLPADTWSVLGRRAAASGMPLGDYVRQELISMARRSSLDESMQEFREALKQDPSLDIDLSAVEETLRYVRGM